MDGCNCSATQEDDMGQLYLSNIDFLKNGVPASIIATAVSRSSIECVYEIDFSAGCCYRWLRPHEGHWVSPFRSNPFLRQLIVAYRL